MIQIAKNAGFNYLATLVVAITGFLSSIFAARVLGPSSFGVFSYATWLFSTLLLFTDIGISSAIQKFISELEGSDARTTGNRLSLGLFIIQIAIGLTIGMLIISNRSRFENIIPQQHFQEYLTIIGIGIPIAITVAIFRARIAGFQRFDILSIISIITGVFSLFGTTFILAIGFKIRGLLWLSISIYCLQLFVLAYFIWTKYPVFPQSSIPFTTIKRLVPYCLGAFLWTVVDAVIWQRSETFFLGRYSTTEQIGYYGLAYGIATSIVTMLPFAVVGVLMPALSHFFGANDHNTMRKIYTIGSKYMVIISSPIAIGGIAIANVLVVLLFGKNYSAAIGPLRILLVSNAMGAMAGPGSALLLALGKPYIAGIIGIPIAIINLVLAYVLVPQYGAVGAAVANTICQVIGVMAGTIYLTKFLSYQLPIKAILRTIVAAMSCGIIAYLVVGQFNGWIGLVAGIFIGAVVYLLSLVIMHALEPEDYQILRTISELLPGRLHIMVGRILSWIESLSIQSGQLFRRKL